MIRSTELHVYGNQRGAALFTVLIMLVALTLVCLTSLSASLLEMRMSANEESSIVAFESAQAGLDATLANADDAFVVAGSVPNTNCYNRAGCNNTIASLPAPIGAHHTIVVTRTSDAACPPRTRDYASSCAKQHAVNFDVDSAYDDTAAGNGKAGLVQGYIKLTPAIQDLTTAAPTSATSN